LTAYDWLLARRTLALGIALGILAFVVMLGTDDATSTLAGRVGRLAALVSLAGGGGAFIATEQARSRGEMRALGAAGVRPVKASLGAIAGGAAVGALGPVLALVHRVDLTPLFPHVGATTGWVRQGDAWLEATQGIVVRATGEVSRVAPTAVRAIAEGPAPRWATAAAFALAAVGFPLWATAESAALRRSLVALAVATTAVAVFHLVAAGQMSPAMLVVPPALLLCDAALLHRGTSWR
jgi:hypothetical protein